MLNYTQNQKLKHKKIITFLCLFVAKIPHAFTLKPKTQTQTSTAHLLPSCAVLVMFRPASDRPAVASPRPPQGGGKDVDVDVDGVPQIYFEETKVDIKLTPPTTVDVLMMC